MDPEQQKPEPSPGGASRSYAGVDRAYQRMVRPDRSIEPETGKRPWLAALLSFLVVGGGQIYNRQLAKAVLLWAVFYVGGSLALVLYTGGGYLVSVLARFAAKQEALRRLPELEFTFLIVWLCLWIFSMVDAHRMAEALRSGRMVVRFGFVRQAAHFAAGFVPFVGLAVPPETVRREELDQPVGPAVTQLAKDRAVEWILIRTARWACLVLGVALIIGGLVTGTRPLISFGGLALGAGILLFLA